MPTVASVFPGQPRQVPGGLGKAQGDPPCPLSLSLHPHYGSSVLAPAGFAPALHAMTGTTEQLPGVGDKVTMVTSSHEARMLNSPDPLA